VGKEMYTFEDRGGRSLTLRPEGTAPVVRAYLSNVHDLPPLFKAYYLEPEWRYGRPQSGRLREFRVFGIEAIGVANPGADVEVMVIAHRFLTGLGLTRLEVQVNSIGDENCRPAYRAELVAYLRENRERLGEDHREGFESNPMRLLDCKDEACRRVSLGAPTISDWLCEACREHFSRVLEGLEEESVPHVHAPRLVRGLDYYTRTAFEFVSAVLSDAQSTVCGGGRYDGLAEVLGGPPTPGVGFGAGLDRIALALDAEGVAMTDGSLLECFTVAVGEGARAWAAEVTRSFREGGISAATAFEPRSLKGQLRMADRSGARFALVIGERESTARTVTVRRLDDGHQRELGLDQAMAWILSMREPAVGEATGPGASA
jgi:histidyl-tRNA synthetase